MSKPAQAETNQESSLRIQRTCFGFLSLFFLCLTGYFIFKGYQAPEMSFVSTSNTTCYIYACAAGGAFLGSLGQYNKVANVKVCPMCRQYVHQDAVKCQYCHAELRSIK